MKSAFSVATLLALTQATKLESKAALDLDSEFIGWFTPSTPARQEHWSEMKNLLDVDDDGALTGDELQGYATEEDLEEAWGKWDTINEVWEFEPTEEQFVDLTFNDFNFADNTGDATPCDGIYLSEFQDALETDSWWMDNEYESNAGGD